MATGPCGFALAGSLGLAGAFGLGGAGGTGGDGETGAAGFTIFTGTSGPSLTRTAMEADAETTPATMATWTAEEPTR
jgi:hypothetical protein